MSDLTGVSSININMVIYIILLIYKYDTFFNSHVLYFNLVNINLNIKNIQNLIMEMGYEI